MTPDIALFFDKYFGNLTNLDGRKSHWYNQDVVLEAIYNTCAARSEFSKNYYKIKKQN
jgi:hypothetical protein